MNVCDVLRHRRGDRVMYRGALYTLPAYIVERLLNLIGRKLR